MWKFIIGCIICIVLIGCADKQAPEVEITYPVNGSVVNGTETIAAEATDNESVVRVEFYIDDSLVSTSTAGPYTYAWITTPFQDSTIHTIHAQAYDAAENEGISQAVSVIVDNGGVCGGFYSFDNFNFYPSSTPDNPPYVELDGYGNWTASEWNIMRQELPLDENYIMVRDFPPSPDNYATYRAIPSCNISSLFVGFTYIKHSQAELSIYISPDTTNWTDVTEQFNLVTTTTSIDAEAELTTFISGFVQDIYVRFETAAIDTDNWMCAIDDFWISGDIE